MQDKKSCWPGTNLVEAIEKRLAKWKSSGTTQSTKTDGDKSGAVLHSSTQTASSRSLKSPPGSSGGDTVSSPSGDCSTFQLRSSAQVSSTTPDVDTSSSSATGATSSSGSSACAVVETSCAADLWKETYNLYISQLSGKDEALVTETQNKATWNPELLEKTFSALRQKYSQNRFSKVLHKINALLLHIKSFGTVMDVFVQAGSMFAPLIWGTAKLVLEVATRSVRLFERICGMIESLDRYIPVFEDWAWLFPEESYSLVAGAMKLTFHEYIKFMVDAIKYMRGTGFANTIRLAVSPSFEANFKKTESKIKLLTENLIIRVETAAMRANHLRHLELKGLLLESTSLNRPHTAMPKPRKLVFLQSACRNDKFFGRTSILKNISTLLVARELQLCSVALCGLGGMGKSQIAIQYLHLHADDYPIIIWLAADTKDKLETQFNQIARKLGFKDENGNSDRRRDAVLHWLAESDVPWLIIFDNVESPSLVQPFWPASLHGSVILTSRYRFNENDGPVPNRIDVKSFSLGDSIDFLQTFLDPRQLLDEDRTALGQIAEIFSGLPLGLKTAGAYMNTHCCSPSKFVRLGLARQNCIQDFMVQDCPSSLYRLWDLSLSVLDVNAMHLLHIIALLDPDCIPLSLFETSSLSIHGNPNPSGEVDFLEALGNLSKQSLVDFSGSCRDIRLHRYFHSAILHKVKASAPLFRHAFASTVLLLLSKVPGVTLISPRSPKLWPVREQYAAHFRCLQRSCHVATLSEFINPYVELLFRFAYWYYETGQYRCGLETIQAALLVDKNLGPVKSKLVSLLHFTRGQILNECNQPEKSIESFKLAISLYELAKDPDLEFANTYLSRLYSQFGNSLTGSGRYTESEFYHDKAIRLTKALGKPTPRQMGILYANLGSTLLWKGDLSKAEDVLKRALLEHDRILECNKYALANVYIRQKRLDEAFQLHSEVLELFSRDLGRSHHATADSCHKVGSILTMKEFSGRNLQDAEKWMRRALKIYEAYLNQENIEMGAPIARTKWKLAQTLREIGGDTTEEVEKFEQEATTFLFASRAFLGSQNSGLCEVDFDNLVFYWSK